MPTPTRLSCRLGDRESTPQVCFGDQGATTAVFPATSLYSSYSSNVDLNYKDQLGSYGLITHLANDNPSKEFVETMIKHGADIFVQDQDGKMAFFYAMRKGEDEILDLLIETSRQKRREEGCVDDPDDPPFLPDSVLPKLPNVTVVNLGK